MASESSAATLGWPKLTSTASETKEDDAELVRLVIERNPRATTLLWKRFAPSVRSVIRRAIWPNGDVEDLVQDVFVLLFRKLPTLREPTALRAFVFAVSASVAASELRRLRVRRWLRLTGDGELPERASAARDDDGREALAKIYSVLGKVGDRDRMTFVLRTLEGLELPDVASAMNMSVATVKRRVARVHEQIEREVHRDPALAQHLGLLNKHPGEKS